MGIKSPYSETVILNRYLPVAFAKVDFIKMDDASRALDGNYQ